MSRMLKEGRHYRERDDWTDRQKQVLDLLARGRTNGEIAQALGVTLDGAKYHVSEVITRLGVKSRDEAAEYWRTHTGGPARLRRALLSLGGPGAAKWAGAGTAVVVLGGLVAVAAFMLLDQDGQAPFADDATPAATTATVERVQTAATETPPVATATPSPALNFVDGIDGEPVTLPEGVVIYYYGYVFTEGIPADRWLRAHQTSEGLVVRDLTESLPEGTGALSTEHGYGPGIFRTNICVEGYCGGHGEPSPDARSETYVSGDGGITWQVDEVEQPPLGTHVVGVRSDGTRIAGRYDPGSDTFEWFTWPGLTPVEPPVANARATTFDGKLAWVTVPDGLTSDGGTVYDERGTVIARPVTIPSTGNHGVIRGESLDLVWWIPTPRDSESTVYISEVSPEGDLVRTVKLEGFDLWPIGWIDRDRIVMRRWLYHGGSLAHTVILNFETGEVNRVAGLQPTEQDRDSYVIGVVAGEFAMVNTPGTCLYVREEADTASEALQCFADGVLFEVAGDTVAGANGSQWVPVRAPGGTEGYASAAFLIR